MRNRRVVTIGREGVYYLFLVAFIMGSAAARDVNLLIVLAGLMVGPLLLNWRIVVTAIRQLEIERRLPRQAFAGQPFVVQVRGYNGRRRLGSWMLVVEDSIQAEAADPLSGKPARRVPSRVLLPYVAAGQSGTAAYRVLLPQRGAYQFGPLQAGTGFPLGLVRGSVRQRVAERLVVYPRLGRLLPGWASVLETPRFGEARPCPADGRRVPTAPG